MLHKVGNPDESRFETRVASAAKKKNLGVSIFILIIFTFFIAIVDIAEFIRQIYLSSHMTELTI